MLGGVPIIVIIPPKIEAKAIGINNKLGDLFCSQAVLSVTGNIRAKAPTLFMKADKIAITPLKLLICIV